jgi:Flp pilus assembly protein TadD
VARCHNGIGLAQIYLGEVAAALESFDLAIATDPGDARVYHNRAEALRSLGRFAEAAADSARAAELDPDDSDTKEVADNAITLLIRCVVRVIKR